MTLSRKTSRTLSTKKEIREAAGSHTDYVGIMDLVGKCGKVIMDTIVSVGGATRSKLRVIDENGEEHGTP